MLSNYLRVFLRNCRKHPGYTLSNISSLAVGMATCVLILLFVRYETSWNSSNVQFDRAYRVQQKVFFPSDFAIYTQTGFALASELKKQIPEIEQSATLHHVWGEYLSSSTDLTFHEKEGYYADGRIFDILTFDFLEGSPANALSEPFSIVVTRSLAKKYFPGQDAMGKMLRASKNKLLKITGIIDDLPFNLDRRPDYMVSLATYREVTDWKAYDQLQNISAALFETYVTLKPQASLRDVNAKVFSFQDKYVENNFKKLYLKPLPELHLTAGERNDIEIALYYVSAFAIFVLVLASVNYVSMATASSYLRMKEIGIRKAVGASRNALFSQFIFEAVVLAVISMIVAFALVEVLLPYFDAVVERPIDITLRDDGLFLLAMGGICVATGFLSGAYPALYLSGFQPSLILRGNVSLFRAARGASSKPFLRKALVALQFSISVLMLTGTVYVVNQVHYMKTKDLGFDKRDLLICSVYGSPAHGSMDALRNRLLENPAVLEASVSTNAPFHGNWGKEINWEGADQTEKIGIRFNQVDEHFVDTYRMSVILGRNFSRQFADQRSCLINETAWRAFKWENPLGKKIDDKSYTVVGVVKDFHPYSVHEKIPPFYLVLRGEQPEAGTLYTVRVRPEKKEETLAHVRRVFGEVFPDAIIEALPFDSDIDIGTKGVWEIVESMFIGFGVIAVLIAANGMFGMISFAAQRRMKEIGVRKVFGASVPQMFLLMTKEFAFLVLASGLMAFPSAYLLAHTTPGAYKYQVQFTDHFLAIGVMVVTAVLATVYHTTKAAVSNPVETLRYE